MSPGVAATVFVLVVVAMAVLALDAAYLAGWLPVTQLPPATRTPASCLGVAALYRSHQFARSVVE